MTTTPAFVPAEPGASGGSPPRTPIAIAATVCVAVLLVGGAIGYLAGHHSGSSSSPAAFGGPSGAGGFAGPGSGGSQGFNGPGGGIAGEERIQGTLGGVSGSTITVETSSGSTAYTVTPTTEIVRNGRQASLSDLKPGEQVLVHVYLATSGQMQVERIFAGTLLSAAPASAARPRTARGGRVSRAAR